MNESTPFYKMAEFWIATVDAVIAVALKIANLYASNEALQTIEFIIEQAQPIVIMIIVSMLGTRIARAVKQVANDAAILIAMNIKSK